MSSKKYPFITFIEKDMYITKLFGERKVALTQEEEDILNRYIYDVAHPVWRQVIIDGKDTGYQVSNTGIVVDEHGAPVQYYQQYEDWYFRVYIKRVGAYSVHRLVGNAFIPNPENKPQINHINGNKDCNWVGNLEWVTAKENSKHAWEHELVNNYGENQGHSIYTNEQIHQVCKLLEDNKLSYSEIAKITNVKYEAISEIRNKRKWKFISDKYNIPPPPEKMYSDESVKRACKLLENPDIPYSKISKETGLSVNALKDIMKKTSYARISSAFDIKKRSKQAISRGHSHYNVDQIRQVCQYLESTNKPIKEISELTNVGLSVVYDIFNHRKWTSVSSNYKFQSMH